ncbi:MAG: histidine phosphatase family protein [Rhizobiales bacterium]|nr:histidine phosphatase family protein [Hyphomicrobiales bacterium]
MIDHLTGYRLLDQCGQSAIEPPAGFVKLLSTLWCEDERALAAMGQIRLDLRTDAAWVSPMRAARQTAERLSLDGKEDPELRELSYGNWTGRTIAEIDQEQPERLARWISDPDFDDHGGESVAGLLKRAGAWIEKRTSARGRIVAVTHTTVIKATIVHVLRAPPDALWRIDIAPLTFTDVRHDGRRWAIRSCGSPLPIAVS